MEVQMRNIKYGGKAARAVRYGPTSAILVGHSNLPE
jgi:hypothetical protein